MCGLSFISTTKLSFGSTLGPGTYPHYIFTMLTSQKVIDAINEQNGYEFSSGVAVLRHRHFAAEALPQSQHFFSRLRKRRSRAAIHQICCRCWRARGDPGNRRAKIEIKTARDAVASLDQKFTCSKSPDWSKGAKQNDYITINFPVGSDRRSRKFRRWIICLRSPRRAGTDLP
jgi:hypothetical protein